MLDVYPLKPVISDDPTWKAVYDDHPESISLTSACLTPAEARRLVAEGAVFDTVVVLNEAGADFFDQLARKQAAENPEQATRVERVSLVERSAESIQRIHDYLRDQPFSEYFQTAGG